MSFSGHARIAEVALWDRPLDEAAAARLHELGLQGKPLWPVEVMPEPIEKERQRPDAGQPSFPHRPQQLLRVARDDPPVSGPN
jgi:hypothetical protein